MGEGGGDFSTGGAPTLWLGTAGVGIHTETMDIRIGRKTCISWSCEIMTIQKAMVMTENNTWAVNIAHCML